MTECNEIWSTLESESGSGGTTVRRVRPEDRADIFLGIERPQLTRVILVEAARSSIDRFATADLDCAGFTVRKEGVIAAPTRGRLVVRLRERRYLDIFSSLAKDVLASIPAGCEDTEVIVHTVKRLFRWKQFLAARGEDGLSRERRQGLFAELWFLLHHAVPACGNARAISAWTGPLGRPQDFQFSKSAVEVKSTVVVSPEVIRVANARQLDPPVDLSLHLLLVLLEERAGTGETLPQLVQRVRTQLSDCESELEDRLLQVGYLDADARGYAGIGYMVRGHRYFAVHNDFPRLKEDGLPVGVTDVAYSISLGACERFRVADHEVHSSIGALP